MKKKWKNPAKYNGIISSTSLRKYILIILQNAGQKNLGPKNVLNKIQSTWECTTIWITEEKCESGGFSWWIGLVAKDASKHTLKNKSRNLFADFSEDELAIKCFKGKGALCKTLSEKKSVLLFGESSVHELVQLARASQQHKKAQRLSPRPERKKKQKSSPKKDEWLRLRTFFKKTFSLIKHAISIIFEQVVRALAKAFTAICLYIYFFKILQIDKIDPQFFANMTWWELFSFLLGGRPPQSSTNWTPFLLLAALFTILK